jgi:integrase
MSSDRTTINVVLYKSKTLANGEHPIMLRIIRNKVMKYVSLGISTTPKFWDPVKQEVKRNHSNRDMVNAIISKKKTEYLNEVLTYKHNQKDFTPDVLVNKVEKGIKKSTVLKYFSDHIQKLKSENRIGYAAIFISTRNSVKRFINDQDITFDQIDYQWLVKYETFLRVSGIAETSMSVFMRTLRTLYIEAMNNHYVNKDHYPFDKFSVTKRFSTETEKRAVTKDQVKHIEALLYKPYSMHFEAQQYFLFSYYGMGINFTDIAHLKWENITEGRITYRRQKTGELITFKVTYSIERIISFWRPLTGNSAKNYVFPILNLKRHITPTQIHNRTKKVLGRVNEDLKEIGELAGLSIPLTTYVARHSFATVLKRNNVATAVISEMMGHKTEAITQVYLKSFENSVLDEAQEHL